MFMNETINNYPKSISYQSQKGIGIVEIMVALILLAIAVLGFSAMQTTAVKATSESVDRTQALTIMRSISEKIRTNSSAVDEYQKQFNSLSNNIDKGTTFNAPTKRCDNITDNKPCTPTELAASDTYDTYLRIKDLGFNMNIVACPATGGTGTTASTSVMYSYCIIAAWDKTKPTKGSDKDKDCISDTVVDKDGKTTSLGGVYYPKATCMFMEVN